MTSNFDPKNSIAMKSSLYKRAMVASALLLLTTLMAFILIRRDWSGGKSTEGTSIAKGGSAALDNTRNGKTQALHPRRPDNSKIMVGKQVRPIMEKNGNDLAKVISEIMATYHNREQRALLGQLAEVVGATNDAAAITGLLDEVDRQVTGELRYYIYGVALAEMAKSRPQEAVVLSERLGIGVGRQLVLAKLFSAWSGQDLEGAAIAGSKLEFPEERKAVSGAFSRAVMADPMGGLRLLLDARIGSDIKEGIGSGVGRYWKGSAAELARLFDGSNASLLATTLSGMAYKSPMEVLMEARKNPDIIASSQLQRSLANGFSESNPAGALSQIVQMEDFPQKSVLMRATFARWLVDDSLQGSEWLAGLRDSEHRGVHDQLASHLVGFLLMKGDRVSAEQWAASITDQKLRSETEAKLPK